MANKLTDNTKLGTIGELFVQAKLLEYGWQAAPPLKDSGNDLVAIKKNDVLFVQVKTTGCNNLTKPDISKLWDVYIYISFSESTLTPYDDAKIQVYTRPDNDTAISRNWKKELVELDEFTLDGIAASARERKLK